MIVTYRYNVGLAYRDVVARRPAAPALHIGRDRVVTHGELNSLANRIAHVLSARGIVRGDVVAILNIKTKNCFAAMLAALKVGAAYVNLDDQNPMPRLLHILGACRPAVVVVDGILPPAVAEAATASGVSVVDFADEPGYSVLARASDAEPYGVERVSGSDPAYIMFTSGSTGVPKGALITHSAVLNFGLWVGERFGVTPDTIFSNVNPMYFDNSVFDFYGSMLNGASMIPIERDLLSAPGVLLERLENASCTIWFSVPSMLIYLTTMKALTSNRLKTVRRFVFGGEGYPKAELRKLHDLVGERSALVNVYGPTECTCICSAWDVRPADLDDPAPLVTLGPVAANFAMLVLDDADESVAPGGIGELCLLGPQVGLGYVDDPERTARSFVGNPLNRRWHERMYRTGDLVRLGDDGHTLHFVGRKDNQIKHMGYRIELEEIEAALAAVEGIVQCAVLHVETRRGLKSLVAYVAQVGEFDEARIVERLAQLLPPYMIPQRVERRDALPKNASGKIDRVALAQQAVSK